MKRAIRVALLSIITILLAALPVYAAYRATFVITETAGTAHPMLPVSVDADNDWMAANNFMKATALDTRIETLGGSVRPHMVSDERTLAASVVPDNSQVNLYFTTGNTDLASLDIITAYNGRVETADAAALEPGAIFETSFTGYIDTTEASTPIFYKPGAILLEVSAAGTLTAGTINADSHEIIPAGFAAWEDVDVSAWVPDDATGVVVEIETASGPKACGVRMNGSTDDRRTDMEHNWTMVGIDANGIFEAYFEDGAVDMFIRGYTDHNWVYKTNAVDISIGAAAWTDIDLTASTEDGATVAIVDIVNGDAVNPRQGNVQMNGSGDNRTPDIDSLYHTYRIVGMDSGEVIEGYAETVDVDMFLMGYCRGGATFALNADDKSLAGSMAWTDIDCSTEAPDATYLFFELIQVLDRERGYRENGSTEAITEDGTPDLTQAVVKCDMNQIVEGYTEDHLSTETYLSGYTTYGIYPPHPNPTYLVSVTAGGGAITSGVHTVVVGDDGGGNLEIDIDAGTWSNSAAIGAGVTNTTDNWRTLISPTVPYTSVLTHSVGGVLQFTYEPVTMILGRVLVDETNAFDGTFCWGDAPVTVELGALVSDYQPTPGDETPVPTPDVMPDIEVTDWFGDHTVGVPLTTNPFRPLVTLLSDNTTLSEIQSWRLYALSIILLVTVSTAVAVRNHLLLAGIMAGCSIGACVALTIFPMWALVFAIGAVLGGAVAERSPSI